MQLLYPKHELQKQPPEVLCKCSAKALQLRWKETPTQVFSCEIRKIFRTPILKNIC